MSTILDSHDATRTAQKQATLAVPGEKWCSSATGGVSSWTFQNYKNAVSRLFSLFHLGDSPENSLKLLTKYDVLF